MSYLDTRDLAKRQSEIESEIEEIEESTPTQERLEDREELQEELSEIEAIEGYCADFKYGETLIPEEDFEDYARELAEDLGSISDDATWPANCIDWKRAALELSQDYTLIEYQGTSYYVR